MGHDRLNYIRPDHPCKDCPVRHKCCHSTCEEGYQESKRQHEELRKRRKKYNDESYDVNSVTFRKKK